MHSHRKAHITILFTATTISCGGEFTELEQSTEFATVNAAPTITRKVAVVIYDPINPQNANERLSDYFLHHDGLAEANNMRDQIAQATNGGVNFSITETYHAAKFPLKSDGFRYNWSSYINCRNNRDTCHQPDRVSYRPLMDGTDTGVNLCERIRNKQIDEVWVSANSYFGHDEFAWKVPGDNVRFPSKNNNPWIYRSYDLPDCGRTYFVMGMTQDRPTTLHAFGHRVESALIASEPGDGYDQSCNQQPRREFTDFTCFDKKRPGYAACGNVHYAPNGQIDYDYTRTQNVSSNCDEWANNYPVIGNNRTGVGANTWQNKQMGYLLEGDLHYSDANTTFKPIRAEMEDEGFPINNTYVWRALNANGDQLTDLIKYWNDGGTWTANVFTNLGSGSFRRERWATKQGGFKGTQKWFIGDVTGDGKDDLLKLWNDAGAMTVDVHRSMGNKFNMERWATKQGGFWDAQKWFVADVTGDGKDDLLKIWNDAGTMTVDVHRSTGSNFVMERWATKQGGFWDAQNWVVADFNGDGRDDLAKYWNDNGNMTVDVHRSTGNNFVIERWATKQGGFWDEQKWVVADFNGDGRDDLAKYWNDNGNMTVDVHRSNGSNFVIERWATKQGGFWDEQKWVVADFNGDGRADLTKYWDDGGYLTSDMHLSSGNSFYMQRAATKQKGFSLDRRALRFVGNFYQDSAKKADLLTLTLYSFARYEDAHAIWWLSKIPRKTGTHKAAWNTNINISNNWWNYILCYNASCS